MAELLKVPPTKSSLLALKKQEHLLQQGYELLERKREILTRLVYEKLSKYKALRKNIKVLLNDSYRWLGITQMRIGSRRLHQVALGLKPALKIRMLPRSSLGVEYPSIKLTKQPIEPVGSLCSDASFEETRIHLAELTLILAQLGEAEISLMRILEEQRKTQKRVNALKYNIIPRYQKTIRFIQSSLEEEERNTLYQIKVLRTQQKDKKPNPEL